MLLVPGDVLDPRRPDEHYAPEAAAVRAAGVPVALVDHDALRDTGDAARAVARVPPGEDAVYRGWMLRAPQYARFAAALADRGVHLRTDPGQYARAHELPGWYEALRGYTPESVWTRGARRDDFDRTRTRLGSGAAVLRDYTKSAKHHWHEAAYVPDLTDGSAAWAVASRLAELREDEFTGGFVLRRFEEFTGAEVRTWWRRGRCVLVTAHPDTPDDPPPAGFDTGAYAPALAALALPFTTVDFARRAGGGWRVIELGDGQVSDRPASTAPEALIKALLDPA
jgi:hypothetical protein